MWIVKIIYWFQAFLAPVLLFGFIGIAFNSILMLRILMFIGVITGIVLAEYIRRKIGLETFFARIHGSNEMDEKLKKKD